MWADGFAGKGQPRFGNDLPAYLMYTSNAVSVNCGWLLRPAILLPVLPPAHIGYYFLSVDDLVGCIEPRVLGPWFAYADDAEELDAVRDILEVKAILPSFVILIVRLRSPTIVSGLSPAVYTFSAFDDDEAAASSSCFLSATLYPLKEIQSSPKQLNQPTNRQLPGTVIWRQNESLRH